MRLAELEAIQQDISGGDNQISVGWVSSVPPRSAALSASTPHTTMTIRPIATSCCISTSSYDSESSSYCDPPTAARRLRPSLKRLAGSFSRYRITASPRSDGTDGATICSGLGVADTCCIRSSRKLRPSNGSVPLSIW
ncbi:MAG: hypothetical protein H7305_01855 [Gemmatimonadaceae bacterium]|nr:hypothetical protein [Gemmatimonadaceae bacterium]